MIWQEKKSGSTKVPSTNCFAMCLRLLHMSKAELLIFDRAYAQLIAFAKWNGVFVKHSFKLREKNTHIEMKVYLDGGCVIILVILKRKKRFAIVVRVSTFIPVLPFGFINFSLNFIDFLSSPLVHLFCQITPPPPQLQLVLLLIKVFCVWFFLRLSISPSL